MSGQDWDGLARSIDQLNSAISQDVRVGDAKVVILNRDAARQVRDAAEAWQRDYGKPTNRTTLDGILAWLGEAPEDWPWTGADIAAMIRDGCPDWHSPGGGAPHRDAKEVADWLGKVQRQFNLPEAATALDVIEWLEEQDWETVSASFAADCARERFDLPELLPEPPRITLEEFAKRGLFPGDVVDKDGNLLGADGLVWGRGTVIVRKDQAARAAVFGWMLHQGYLPSAQSPDHVVVTR